MYHREIPKLGLFTHPISSSKSIFLTELKDRGENYTLSWQVLVPRMHRHGSSINLTESWTYPSKQVISRYGFSSTGTQSIMCYRAPHYPDKTYQERGISLWTISKNRGTFGDCGEDDSKLTIICDDQTFFVYTGEWNSGEWYQCH